MVYHLRRKDKEMKNPSEMRKVLRATKYVSVALSMKNQPYLVTLSHGYDEKLNCIYFHCAKEGKKIDYIRANNRVWGQAFLDKGYADGCDHLYASVHFSGRITLIDDLEEKTKAIMCIIRHLEQDPEPMIAQLKPERLRDILIGKIDIDYMSGKRSEGSADQV